MWSKQHLTVIVQLNAHEYFTVTSTLVFHQSFTLLSEKYDQNICMSSKWL